MLQSGDLFARYLRSYETHRETEMSLVEYLEGCRTDPMMYASAPERLLAAIGEPVLVDTAKDARLGRIFMNRTIRVYPAFSEFYGMEDTVVRDQPALQLRQLVEGSVLIERHAQDHP